MTQMPQKLRRSICGVCCVICVICGEVQAQGTAVIRGDVVQPDTITRVSGIVVVAIDSAGNEAARALSGQTGVYSLTVAAPARYTIRALRVGYRPTIMPPVSVAAGEVRVLRVILAGAALQLNLVRVEGEKGSCRISEERGLLIGSLWEQARTGLVASTLSAGGRPFEATLASYRQFTPKGQRAVEAETLTVIRQTSTSSFHSVPAETLAAAGYATVRGNQVAYHAPDAHALLSPLFEGAHCFDVKLDSVAHPDWIGVAFRPARRAPISDVDGTLWLDRITNELRLLEFRYTNLPRNAAAESADGRVEFVRLLTGDWIISRWAIRTPETEMIVGGGLADRFRSIGTRVVGGFTKRVEQEGIEFYRQSGATLTVTLRARESINSVRKGYVGLVGTTHDALTDSTGAATISEFVPGTYTVVASTEFMTRVGAPAVRQEITVRPGTPARMEIQLPSIEDAIESACGRTSRLRLYFGVVQDAAKKPVVGARLLFEWVTVSQARAGRRTPVTRSTNSVVATSDSEGQWKMCLPAMTSVTVKVMRGEQIVMNRSLTDIAPARDRQLILSIP
jgi:hypothetical protein